MAVRHRQGIEPLAVVLDANPDAFRRADRSRPVPGARPRASRRCAAPPGRYGRAPPRRRARAVGHPRSASTTTGRPIRPDSPAACVRSAWTQALLLEVARPQLEDQRAHLSERVALELAQLGQLAGHLRRVPRHAAARCCATGASSRTAPGSPSRGARGRGGRAPRTPRAPRPGAGDRPRGGPARRCRGRRRGRPGTRPSAIIPIPVTSISRSAPSAPRTRNRERCGSPGCRRSQPKRAIAASRPSAGRGPRTSGR